MIDIILKFVNWFLCIALFILGVYCLRLVTDTGSINPMIGSIFAFGIVFWLSKSTYEGPKNIMISTAVILIGSGLLARTASDLIDVFFYIELGFYFSWAATAFAIGLPVMSYLFYKQR